MTKDKEALAKIKTKINYFYEQLGRETIEGSEQDRQDLIEEIDEILINAEIPKGYLIAEQFLNDMEKESHGYVE